MKKSILLISLFFLLQQSAFFKSPLFSQTIIQAQTGYYINDSFYNWTEEWYTLDSANMAYWTCCQLSDGLKIAVFDSLSCDPWFSLGNGSSHFGLYGEFHCQPYDTPNFDFYDSTDQVRDTIADFLNSIPQNFYVLVMSHKNHYCEEWNLNLINAFRSIGSGIDTNNRIPDGYPYIILGQKGSVPGSANEVIGDSTGALILLTDTLPCVPNSITEIMDSYNISLFPNPALDNITITLPQKSSIEILNIQGQIIKTINVTEKETKIDILNLSVGVYIIKAWSDAGMGVRKFVKE